MEQTFMTIHNLTPDANILFASESISDILGYQPEQVQGKSCFDYFHPDEVPFARSVHSRGVLLDKAAVLHYARILARDGQWVSCECCFTVVHDVLVACTSIYRRGEKSERRAKEAPQIRRIFSSSPRDPRYHMLEHLSPKFKMPPMEREPRAALILNRFTRNLSVMFATNAVASILGLRPDQIKDKSFYRCIQENCLPDALRCLESAKANDSIAYLRFGFRDPREEDDLGDHDEELADASDGEEADGDEKPVSNSTSDSETGGAHLGSGMDLDQDTEAPAVNVKRENSFAMDDVRTGLDANLGASAASNASDDFGLRLASHSSPPPPTAHPDRSGGRVGRARQRAPLPPIELEAVVSCTSDGLVVVLRKARPPIPAPHPPLLPMDFENGLFAAPWAQQPIRPYTSPDLLYMFRPPLLPQYMPLRENVKAAGGPPLDQLMRSIRDVAVFAWALVGINGNIATYGHGLPRGEAQPESLPVWERQRAGVPSYQTSENQAALRWPPRTDKDAAAAAAPMATAAPSTHSHGFAAETPGYGRPPFAGAGNYSRPSWEGAAPNSFYGAATTSELGQPRPAIQQHHLLPGQQPSPSPFHGGIPRELWTGTTTPSTQSHGYAVPTTRSQSPSDLPSKSRYMWQ